MVKTSGARLVCGRAGADGCEGAHDINSKANAASAGICGDRMGKSIEFLLQLDIARSEVCRLPVGLLQRALAGLAQAFAAALQLLGSLQPPKRAATIMSAVQRMVEPHSPCARQDKPCGKRAQSQKAG